MKGKSYSIPLAMVFRKHHCAKCGNRLGREKFHRVVTPEDKDYYQYQDFGTFPRRNYDVYGYRFQCPACNARISFDEQQVIKRIQKQQGSFVLSSSEIKQYYRQHKTTNDSSVLVNDILVAVIFLLISFILVYLFGTPRTSRDLLVVSVLFVLVAAGTVVGIIRKFKGKSLTKRGRTYSYEKETQLEKYHAYSSHNKRFVDMSNRCYCFYCRAGWNPTEIKEFIDHGQTAVCPKCGIDAILPDSVAPELDEATVLEMHEYWF